MAIDTSKTFSNYDLYRIYVQLYNSQNENGIPVGATYKQYRANLYGNVLHQDGTGALKLGEVPIGKKFICTAIDCIVRHQAGADSAYFRIGGGFSGAFDPSELENSIADWYSSTIDGANNWDDIMRKNELLVPPVPNSEGDIYFYATQTPSGNMTVYGRILITGYLINA